ncbi:MAG: M1 family metallopeptidase [Bacteroidetes bacterium]|nr:M1 family metallopeptidase [Bacteroidota bacterium]
MYNLSRLFLFIFMLIFQACARDQNPIYPQQDQYMKDPHSYGNPDEIVIRHLDWKASVSFQDQVISAIARLKLENLTGSRSLVLDTRDLVIEKVTSGPEEIPADFKLGQADSLFGAPLTISVPENCDLVSVYYKTKPKAAALQWLSPGQTSGKQHPFLFTQSQAILARTWIPLQDGPQVRFTYTAEVSVPKGMLALMSASNPQAVNETGVYTFRMDQPIPSYLMALAAGNLEFRPVSSRCGIYAEPDLIERATSEFEDTEKMIQAAETLYGPYRWDRYDVLVLPPSFPFGGMENPRLTFATPTIIAGDKSLVALIAHELAHSWSGNLVTNAVWDDFWLNEGFTVYFEGRIMEQVYGRDFSEMEQRLGFEDLKGTLAELGDSSRDTHLKLHLAGRDPDEGVSDIAYEKGANFLRVCENAAGREKWDRFVRAYFDRFAFTSMTTEKFLEYFETEFIQGDSDLAARIGVNNWVYGPGLPANALTYTSSRLKSVDQEITRFRTGINPKELKTAGWATPEWLFFLRGLPPELDQDKMEKLDAEFHFSQSGNSEILAEWLGHSIDFGYQPAFPVLEQFLLTVGRRKYLRPLYQKMIETPGSKERAWSIYTRARPGYHSVSVRTIDEMIGWK